MENIYTWAEQEDGLPEGYELTDTKTEELLAPPMEGEEVLPTETVSIITTLTNTHTPETVNIEGAKTGPIAATRAQDRRASRSAFMQTVRS